MKSIHVLAFIAVISQTISAQEIESSNPLQPFDYLVGGKWSTETTVQTFEWGVGQKSVYSKLFFINDMDTTLSGEITWFWHPGKQQIKGYGHLLSNQVSFFDYTTEFNDSNIMSNSIVGYNMQSMSIPIHESIEFSGENQYIWTMYELVIDELKPQMSIVFNRKN